MKGIAILFLGAAMTATPAHVSNSFQFVVRAPVSRAAALFGPEGERCWAGDDWDPEFRFPQPAKDVQGAVFTIRSAAHTSIWVNTLFDTRAGRMQYVALIPEKLVSIVDVRLTPLEKASTTVEVTYTRTALDTAANQHVHALGNKDRESGPEWQQAIEHCLAAGLQS